MKIHLSSKEMACIEDNFEASVVKSLGSFIGELMDSEPDKGFLDEMTQAIYNCDIHNEIKQTAYALFEEMGYEFESDGMDF